jgi:hypothetical protein
MNRNLLFASTLVLVALAADQARAGTVYNFSSSGDGVAISGTLTTSDIQNGDGSYTIESITGTYSDPLISSAITGLLPPGFADNELFVSAPGVPGPGPYLDENGFWFEVGPYELVTIEYIGRYQDTSYYGSVGLTSFTLTSSAVPEPSSLVLGGIAAIGGLMAVVRRRRAAVAA